MAFNPHQLDELDVLTRTVWGEARGEPDEGKIAVAHSVLNRVNAHTWYGNNIKEVCLRPQQYACWNENDPNYQQIANLRVTDPGYQHIYRIVQSVTNGNVLDNTHGSTHYHVASVPHAWANGHQPVVQHGAHLFYNTVR